MTTKTTQELRAEWLVAEAAAESARSHDAALNETARQARLAYHDAIAAKIADEPQHGHAFGAEDGFGGDSTS